MAGTRTARHRGPNRTTACVAVVGLVIIVGWLLVATAVLTPLTAVLLGGASLVWWLSLATTTGTGL